MKTSKLIAFHAPSFKPKMIPAWQEGYAGELSWKAPLFSPSQMKSLCLDLKEKAQSKLSALSPEMIAKDLGRLSRLWLNRNYRHRIRAEKIIAASSGCSLKNIREGLDLAFEEVSEEKIIAALPLIKQLPQGRLTYCVFAGIISTPMLFDIFLSLLRKSAVMAKSPSREPFFPILLAQSLHEFSPALGQCIAALWWPGGQSAIEKEACRQARFINAYGDDATVAKITSYAGHGNIFIPLGHKISLSFAGKKALAPSNIQNLTDKIAYDVSIYDQQGCLSPHVIYLEDSSGFNIPHFLKAMAESMKKMKHKLPIGKLSFAEASRIQQIRGQYLFKKEALCVISPLNTDWTLIYEKNAEFHPSCLNRVLFIKTVSKMELLREILKDWKGKIQGLAYETGDEANLCSMADDFDIPVCRPIGQIQQLRFEDHIKERLRIWHGKKP